MRSQSSNYWSATEYNATNAWNVRFSDGNVNNNNKDNANYVRCVSGCQNVLQSQNNARKQHKNIL